MEITSLGFRTDLALLRAGGSTVTDRGDHLVVRTPANPAYWWGNFFLLAEAPADAGFWLDAFAREFPDAEHATFGIDLSRPRRASQSDAGAFAQAGLTIERSRVMTASAVRPPPRPNVEASFRALTSDHDWARQLSLSVAGEESMAGWTADFATAKNDANRALVDAGHGQWWGAFLDEVLAASMGLFAASPGLARFQTVKTHPDFRGRGLAGTLAHRVGEWGVAGLGASTLVMVADPDYPAIRIYRSIGFEDTESMVQCASYPQGQNLMA